MHKLDFKYDTENYTVLYTNRLRKVLQCTKLRNINQKLGGVGITCKIFEWFEEYPLERAHTPNEN